MALPEAAVSNQFRPMLIIGGLFFILGFVTWLNGPLITFVRLALVHDDFGAFLVPLTFYVSYFCWALPASAMLRRTGMKNGMAIGLFVMAIGTATFGYFATQRTFSGALTGLFCTGAGLAILQTASNPYVVCLGAPEGAARRIAIMGICSKTAGVLAPLVLGYFVMGNLGELTARVAAATDAAARAVLLDDFAARIYKPYMLMAAVLAAIAVLVRLSPLPNISPAAHATGGGSGGLDTGRHLSQFPQVWLGFLAIFACIGTEVLAGDGIGTYGNELHLPLDHTKVFTALTLAAMLVGYVVGLVLVPRRFSQETYLGLSALLGIGLTVAASLTRDYVSVGCIALLGFANAMMWPAIFPLGIRGLAQHTEAASGVLVMGIVGGAVFPQLFAQLKIYYDFQAVFAGLMIPAYLYLLVFAWWAAKRPPVHQGRLA
jgi:MFS transporter, FHS family, L-fucose permease